MAKAKISKGNGNSKSKDDDSPLSMDELLLKYSGTPFALKRGNRVRGTVVEKEAKRILIDIGGKGEGVVELETVGRNRNACAVGSHRSAKTASPAPQPARL